MKELNIFTCSLLARMYIFVHPFIYFSYNPCWCWSKICITTYIVCTKKTRFHLNWLEILASMYVVCLVFFGGGEEEEFVCLFVLYHAPNKFKKVIASMSYGILIGWFQNNWGKLSFFFIKFTNFFSYLCCSFLCFSGAWTQITVRPRLYVA